MIVAISEVMLLVLILLGTAGGVVIGYGASSLVELVREWKRR